MEAAVEAAGEAARQVVKQVTKKVAKKASDQGQHVYVYNNLRTNQVVYSLSRTLDNNDALRQLTYTGKNSIPRALRKDLWRPLLTVTFPSALQGLSAYRKLREFRRLHETAWTDDDVAARRTHVLLGPGKLRNKEKEDEEGEDWWRDAERKPDRKERKMMLMDQKANSIADLAAVLFAQEKQGAQRAEEVERQKAENARKEKERWATFEALAKRAKGGEVEKLEERIKELEQAAAGREKASDEEGKKTAEKQDAELKRLRRTKQELQHAKNQVEKRAMGEIPDTAAADITGLEITRKGPWPPPKYGPVRKQMLRPEPYVPATEGVKIQWANILDAEFAESWPKAVAHEIMGLFRHQAPGPEGEGPRRPRLTALQRMIEDKKRRQSKKSPGLKMKTGGSMGFVMPHQRAATSAQPRMYR